MYPVNEKKGVTSMKNPKMKLIIYLVVLLAELFVFRYLTGQ